MKAHIQIHYTYNGVTAMQQGSFYIKRSIPYTAYEWIEEIRKMFPGMKIEKVLGNGEDITDEVREMEKWK